MKFIKTLTFLLAISACSRKIENSIQVPKNHNRTEKQNINSVYENVNFFKYLIFRKCIENGYNDSGEVNAILKEEILLVDFPYGIETIKLVDSLAYQVRVKIESDSIFLKEKWLTKNSDFQDLSGKRVIAHCLEYFLSPELDSLAKKYNLDKE